MNMYPFKKTCPYVTLIHDFKLSIVKFSSVSENKLKCIGERIFQDNYHFL